MGDSQKLIFPTFSQLKICLKKDDIGALPIGKVAFGAAVAGVPTAANISAASLPMLLGSCDIPVASAVGVDLQCL